MSQRIASIAAILNEDSESTDSEEYLSVPTGVTPVTKSSVRERHADVETRERTKSSPCSSSAKEDPLNTQSVKKRAEVDLDSKRNIPSSATQQKPTTSRNKNGSQEASDFNVKRTEHDEYNFDGEQFPEISPVRDEVSAPSMNNSLQEETPEKRIVETLLRGKQPTSHLMNSEWMEKSQPNRIKVINSPGSKTLNTKDTTEEWSGSKSNKNGLANNSRSTFQYSTEGSMNQHANLNQFLAHQTPSKVMATTHKKIHTQQYRDGSTTVGDILDPKQRNTTSTGRRPKKDDHDQEVSRYHSIPNYDNDPQMRSTQNPLSVHERSLYKKAHLIEQFNEKFGTHFMTVAYRNSTPNTPSAESGADKSFARSLPQNVSSPSIMYGTQNSHHVVHENLKERLIAENRRLTLEIGELTAELAACRSQSENKSSRLALAREAQWSYQAQELQNENNILKAQVDELNGHYTRMKGQVEAVTRELRTAREHMNTSQIQIETLEARIQDREMALSSESANCGRLRADLRDRTSELGRLRVEKETQHRESDNRIRELTELLDEANRQRINFIETAEKHDRERTELLSAKQELVNQLRVAQVELHRYQNSQGTELEKLRHTLRKVQLDKDEMEAALESTTKTLDRVGEVEKTHREEIKRLKETRSLMESRISELQGEVERSSVYYNQLVELNEENQRLAQECDRAVLVRQEMHKECERLRTELKELHQIVASTTKKHLSQTMGNVTSVQKSPGSTANHYPWSNGM